jgi:hypothetical protein
VNYLALESGRPHARASLAALLWPRLAPENALDNLRKSIYRLRQTMEQVDLHAPPMVAVIRQTLQFVPSAATGPGPYEDMNIGEIRGVSQAVREMLVQLNAAESCDMDSAS